MIIKRACGLVILYLAVFTGSAVTGQDFYEKIGYRQLIREMGDNMPDGSSVILSQMEPNQQQYGLAVYMPDETHPSLADDTLIFETPVNPGLVSAHADNVAHLLYGKDGIAYGIDEIHVYYAIDWLLEYGLNFDDDETEILPEVETSDIQNHSWSATPNLESSSVDWLRRFDYAINRDQFLAVVGLNSKYNIFNNLNTHAALLAPAYNALTVGIDAGDELNTTGATDIDGGARVKPDFVVPFQEFLMEKSTHAVAIASGCAALLLDFAKGNPGYQDGSSRGLYPETLRALLLAGTTKRYLSSWNNAATQPLDIGNGTGLLNIYRSMSLLVEGSENYVSGTDNWFVPAGDDIDPEMFRKCGWKRYSSIDPAGAQEMSFTVPRGYRAAISSALTWNREISLEGDGTSWINPTSILPDMRLELIHRPEGLPEEVVAYSDAAGGSLEYIYQTVEVPLEAIGDSVQLVLKVESDIDSPFALAWYVDLLPISYESWAGAFELAENGGPDADPDGDGLSNLLEYAFHFNPSRKSNTLYNSYNKPREEDGVLYFTSRRRFYADDLVFGVEYLDPGEGWVALFETIYEPDSFGSDDNGQTDTFISGIDPQSDSFIIRQTVQQGQ